MMASVTVTDNDAWRTPSFRQNMVTKIDEAILHCGAPTTKNAIEMEGQVFSKAKSKDEYLGFVARLIIHIKEMGKNKLGGGPSQINQGQAPGNPGQQQGQIQGQLMGGGQVQNNLMMNQMGGNNGPMGGMNNLINGQPAYNMNNGQMQVNMNQPSTSMMQGSPQLQQQLQQQQQQLQQQQQQQQPQMMNQNFLQQQAMQQQQQQQQQAMQQQQMQNSQLQNPQMQNQQMQNQQLQNQQMQNQQMQQNQQQMQNQQMQNQQLQNQQLQNQQLQNQQMQNPQMQNPQLQGMLSGQNQQQAMMMPRMQNAQMMGNRMLAPQPNMANQLTQMAQQQQRKAMGIPRIAETGPNFSTNYNRVNYYGSNMAQNDGIGGMPGQYGPGGSPMQRPMGQGQFIPPNASQPMGMGPAPSPGSMGGSQGPPYGSSPGSAGMMHSPAGGVGMNTLRPYPNQMVPSPGTSLNTPLMAAPTPSPRNAEDQACFEKIKELRKYTDLLQRMIAKIGNDDVEKSSKMKKLLEILTNPNQRVSMEVLLKCETALKRMERTDAGGPASVPQQTPGKEQTSPFTQFFDCVQNMSKYPSSGHTWRRTVEPAMHVFYGNALNTPVGDDDPPSDPEPESELPQVPWVLTKELRLLNTARYTVKLRRQNEKSIILQVECTLVDQNLPTVPPLRLNIDPEYPDTRPQIVGLTKDYGATAFLTSVQKAFQGRLYYMSHKFTVTELLGAWEMAVRQVSNPINTNPQQPCFKTSGALQMVNL